MPRKLISCASWNLAWEAGAIRNTPSSRVAQRLLRGPSFERQRPDQIWEFLGGALHRTSTTGIVHVRRASPENGRSTLGRCFACLGADFGCGADFAHPDAIRRIPSGLPQLAPQPKPAPEEGEVAQIRALRAPCRATYGGSNFGPPMAYTAPIELSPPDTPKSKSTTSL